MHVLTFMIAGFRILHEPSSIVWCPLLSMAAAAAARRRSRWDLWACRIRALRAVSAIELFAVSHKQTTTAVCLSFSVLLMCLHGSESGLSLTVAAAARRSKRPRYMVRLMLRSPAMLSSKWRPFVRPAAGYWGSSSSSSWLRMHCMRALCGRP